MPVFTMSTTPTSTLQSSQTSTTPPTQQTSQMCLAPPQPNKGRFNCIETEFLRTFQDAYTQHCQELAQRVTGPHGTGGGVKGKKSDWVIKHVYLEFIAQFKLRELDGPNLDSLKLVVKAVFFQHYVILIDSIEIGAVVSEQCSSK